MVDDGERVQSLWARMDVDPLPVARKRLAKREGTCVTSIGFWSEGNPPPGSVPELDKWAEENGVDGVVWTALPPKFRGNSEMPAVEEVVTYLRTLTGCRRHRAEEYIRKAPQQIDTAYRRRIERELHWVPIETESG